VHRSLTFKAYEFIRKSKFDIACKLIKLLIGDNEDISKKAVGWMLREMEKRNKT